MGSSGNHTTSASPATHCDCVGVAWCLFLCGRLVAEEDKESPVLYFNMANSRIYQEKEIQGMEIDEEACVYRCTCTIEIHSTQFLITFGDTHTHTLKNTIDLVSCRMLQLSSS